MLLSCSQLGLLSCQLPLFLTSSRYFLTSTYNSCHDVELGEVEQKVRPQTSLHGFLVILENKLNRSVYVQGSQLLPFHVGTRRSREVGSLCFWRSPQNKGRQHPSFYRFFFVFFTQHVNIGLLCHHYTSLICVNVRKISWGYQSFSAF